MTTATKTKPKSKTATKKRRASSSPPPTKAASKKKAGKRASGATSGGRVVDGDKDKAKTMAAAAPMQLSATPKAGRKRSKRPRIALADKGHTDAITKAVKDLATSKDHICWKRNGKVCELYYRMDGKTPILFVAPATSPVDESGYRVKDAITAITGVFHIKQTIKKTTGKTPSALGIKLPRDASAPNSKSTKAGKPRKKREGLSGLDAAAQVLAKAKEPLNAKTICEQAIALGWKTSGQTPHATLYAAMIREIAAKGDEARFIKVDKGLFTASGKAVA